MRKNLYEAFTLVEMLIVMGILIVLMAVGITAGRFAINRANEVAHQDAVKQIYTALQAYYTDHREFPAATTPKALIDGDSSLLYTYLDSGSFNGGTASTFYYFVEPTMKQSVIVCATLGGEGDTKKLGLTCDGNGFNDADLPLGTKTGADLKDKKVAVDTDGVYTAITGSSGTSSIWYGSSWTQAQ